MKTKLLIVFLFIALLSLLPTFEVDAMSKNYTAFQEIDFDNEKIQILQELNDYQKKGIEQMLPVRRKIFGWDVFYQYKREHFSFIAETLYGISNDGLEDVVHAFNYTESFEKTIQRSTSGSLKATGSGTKDSFKFGLESKLDFSSVDTTKHKISETDSIKFTIAPGTKLLIDVKGEGFLFQGSAQHFFFWARTRKGCFEYAIITTEYYSIDIKKIGGSDNEK